MTMEKIALGCEADCGFIIAGKAHCFENIEPLIEAYNNQCPNCGSSLEKNFVSTPRDEMGLLEVSRFPEASEK